MLKFPMVLIVILCCVGCGSDADGSGNAAPLGTDIPISNRLFVAFHAVLAGPAKSTGEPWDGFAAVDPQLIDRVNRTVGRDRFLSQSAINGLSAVFEDVIEKPDMMGSIQVFEGGEYLIVSEFRGAPNGFEASIAPPVVEDFELGNDTRYRVTMTDEDLILDDAMGTFEIAEADLLAAAQASEDRVWLDVALQTDNEILAVELEVGAR